MRRFASTPVASVTLPGGGRLDAWVAESPGTRLIGLAALGRLPPGTALLLPRCRSVHTLGMRFAVDVAFISEPIAAGACEVIATFTAVPPGRVVRVRGRVAALEAPAGALTGPGVVPGALCQVALGVTPESGGATGGDRVREVQRTWR